MLNKPKALLLDFGGVVAETIPREGWLDELSTQLQEEFRAAGVTALPLERIQEGIVGGRKTASRWKNVQSRVYSPPELQYETFWVDFVAADWPQDVRDYLYDNAKRLCLDLGEYVSERVLRNGMHELLVTAREDDVPVIIVSNALMGDVHRRWLVRNDLIDYFQHEVYSDEVGIRKPNPGIIELGAALAGVSVSECWYVGDTYDRDVACGGRAGVGGNILMHARSTKNPPFAVPYEPDAEVEDGVGLLELYREASNVAEGAVPVATS